VYFSSEDFWWYDTNKQILQSTYSSAAIAMGGAFVVILIASRSLEITILAVIALLFVLLSVTAILVGIGWTLGL
jgi:predicted RND superfamily exporter protein